LWRARARTGARRASGQPARKASERKRQLWLYWRGCAREPKEAEEAEEVEEVEEVEEEREKIFTVETQRTQREKENRTTS